MKIKLYPLEKCANYQSLFSPRSRKSTRVDHEISFELLINNPAGAWTLNMKLMIYLLITKNQ